MKLSEQVGAQPCYKGLARRVAFSVRERLGKLRISGGGAAITGGLSAIITYRGGMLWLSRQRQGYLRAPVGHRAGAREWGVALKRS